MKSEDGFLDFVDREYARLVGALALYCGDVHVAQELAQEAFSRAYQRWSEVSEMSNPAGWVHVVGFNLARSRFRRRAAERRAYAGHGAGATSDVSQPELTDVLAVRSAVSDLPDRQRQVVICRYFLDRTVAETAGLLGISDGAVKAATFKAVRSLRTEFDVVVPTVERADHV